MKIRQCACDEDVNHYKRILRRWINARLSDYRLIYRTAIESLPCSARYYVMAYIEHNVTTEPVDWIDVALRPDTEVDYRETASWLTDLLHRIHREVC